MCVYDREFTQCEEGNGDASLHEQIFYLDKGIKHTYGD